MFVGPARPPLIRVESFNSNSVLLFLRRVKALMTRFVPDPLSATDPRLNNEDVPAETVKLKLLRLSSSPAQSSWTATGWNWGLVKFVTFACPSWISCFQGPCTLPEKDMAWQEYPGGSHCCNRGPLNSIAASAMVFSLKSVCPRT